jgi:hypothetical protein
MDFLIGDIKKVMRRIQVLMAPIICGERNTLSKYDLKRLDA